MRRRLRANPRKKPTRWAAGVIHPLTGKAVGGRIMSARDKKLFRVNGERRKGVGSVKINQAYGRKVANGRSKALARSPKRRRGRVGYPKRRSSTYKTRTGRRAWPRQRIRRKGVKGGYYLRRRPGTPARRTALAKRKKTSGFTRYRRKGYRTASGKWVKPRWIKRRKTTSGRVAKKKKKTKAKRRTSRRSGSYRGVAMAANPYKKAKSKVRSYMRKKKGGNRKSVGVKSFKRTQWYPHRYPPRGKGSKWISNWAAGTINRKGSDKPLLRKRELAKIRAGLWKSLSASDYEISRRLMAQGHVFGSKKEAQAAMPDAFGGGAARGETPPTANPSVFEMLPTQSDLIAAGKRTGVGLLGFASAVAIGKMLNNVAMLNQHLGAWTPVVGNLLAGGLLWAGATATDNMELRALRMPLLVGAGVAAGVNTAYQAVAGGHLPSQYASWVLPAAGSVAAAPTEVVEPTAGFGQIDVYEAALDGMGSIEDELERELERMSGFGEYLETPLGAEVEAAAAGMGEYLETPLDGDEGIFGSGMGEYLETPLGAEVEAAAAGMGEYLETPLGAEVEAAAAGMGQYIPSPMGAEVEAAAAGMGAADMTGLRPAVQNIVRRRIAQGRPLDDQFYRGIGQAAANVARQRMRPRKTSQLQTAPRKAPLLRQSAPTYVKPVTDPSVAPGSAEPIEPSMAGTIFEDEGIF